MYHDQEKRRKDGWTRAGGRAGTCVVPSYNKSHDDCTISAKPNYKINDKRAAVTIFNKALQHHGQPKVQLKQNTSSNKLGDLVMQEYKPTSVDLLEVAQWSISCLLPVEDRECCAAAKLAIEYAN